MLNTVNRVINRLTDFSDNSQVLAFHFSSYFKEFNNFLKPSLQRFQNILIV